MKFHAIALLCMFLVHSAFAAVTTTQLTIGSGPSGVRVKGSLRIVKVVPEITTGIHVANDV